MGKVSLTISGKIREFFPEILVVTWIAHKLPVPSIGPDFM